MKHLNTAFNIFLAVMFVFCALLEVWVHDILGFFLILALSWVWMSFKYDQYQIKKYKRITDRCMDVIKRQQAIINEMSLKDINNSLKRQNQQ